MDGRRNGDADDSRTDEDAAPELVDEAPIRRGSVLAGRYAVEKIIGRGGSGVVVRAHDRDLNQFVAIKIVRADLAGERVWAARLAREVRLARQIHHPHVCRVFDFQQADGRVFLVMELAEGTLRDERRAGTLQARPFAERIADARAVASALAAIHGAGIVHRDLSPQNLLRMNDGRLVTSDFGLATDASESTSVHGGTIAYMAPEVMRGERSTVASDIWSLGALVYEIVFGDKPRWSEGAAPEILTPAVGRKLTGEERAALETARACTVRDPARRIASAAAAVRMLMERRRWRLPRFRAERWATLGVTVLAVLGAVAAGVVRTRPQRSDASVATTAEAPLIVPTGEPVDWTDLSEVLLETPERITCTRLLPDLRTIRFVLGTPPRAEDFDTVTRKRAASPIVPAAYRQGCPDLSPDGKRLLYQGHAKDGRAFAFLSDRPDGKDALPIVPTAEPSMSSEPTWLPDGQGFSFDVDPLHVGLFSTVVNRTTIVPESTSPHYYTIFRAPGEGGVLVSGTFETGETEVFNVSLPWLKEGARFRVIDFALDFRVDRGVLYYVGRHDSFHASIVKVDPSRRYARRLGRVGEQLLRYPLVLAKGLAFVSISLESKLAIKREDGTLEYVAHSDGIAHANSCGKDLIVDRRKPNGQIHVERLERTGRLLRVLSQGPMAVSPACTPDGLTWFFVEGGDRTRILRCDDSGCRVIVARYAGGLSVSPDGSRLAYLSYYGKGPVAEWSSVDGGESHRISDNETGCSVGWASSKTVWVSRRRNAKFVWTEVDADSGTETGRTSPGSRDCTDGSDDPLSPVNPHLRVIWSEPSQLRLLPRAFLDRP